MKKNVLWDGTFFCIDQSCEISKFECIAREIADGIDVHVSFEKKEVLHQKLSNKLVISGDKRWEQKFSLIANGVCNTQSFNAIYNANINDPSMSFFCK